jgi:hypothetical protein
LPLLPDNRLGFGRDEGHQREKLNIEIALIEPAVKGSFGAISSCW